MRVYMLLSTGELQLKTQKGRPDDRNSSEGPLGSASYIWRVWGFASVRSCGQRSGIRGETNEDF